LGLMKRFLTIRVIIIFLGLGFVFGTPTTTLTEPQTAGTPALPEIIFVEAPTVASGPLAERFPQGSHLARLAPGTLSDSAINLTSELFAAADPRVSFDASKVLFAGKKERNSGWQIWEMDADGANKRQLTRCATDCFQPAYLPRNHIVFTMVAGKGNQQTSTIYVSEENGAGARPITFGPGDFQVETVLRSGRILVSAKSTLMTGGQGSESRMFYTLQTDGSGLTPFRWNSAPNVVRTGAEELDDGTVLFVKRQNSAGGELAWIRPGALHNGVITTPGTVYWSAHVLDGNPLVVAKADAGSPGTAGKFGLYVFNLATGSIEKTLYRSPKFSGVEAVALEKRPVPLYYWSILHPDRDYGRVVCLNSYLSADAPHGRLADHIARVRVITLQPDHHTERTLGEAPVESDGSFYIKVPADHSIRFELLSTKGEVIHEQKGWIWARTGEDVPCLGCHESKALVPENRWPLALKRLDAPIPVGVPPNSQSARH
jgi:Hydrazine synthase alpha subunit middle domain